MEILLTYTDQMKEQDLFWQDENENLEVMKQLQEQIVAEAKEKGFNGITKTYVANNEAVTEVYFSLEEKKNVDNGLLDIDCYGNCKGLIKVLEYGINQKKAFNN